MIQLPFDCIREGNECRRGLFWKYKIFRTNQWGDDMLDKNEKIVVIKMIFETN